MRLQAALQHARARSLEIDERAAQSTACSAAPQQRIAEQCTVEEPAAERAQPFQRSENQRHDDGHPRPQRVPEAPLGTASASQRSNGAPPPATQVQTKNQLPPPPPPQEDFYATDSDSLNSEPDAVPMGPEENDIEPQAFPEGTQSGT
jgi:hypothetical protein